MHKQPTTDELECWCGSHPWTQRTATLLRQSGFIDNPLYRWYATDDAPGWDDGHHEMVINGDGQLKTPAHLAFSWLKYSLCSNPRKWVWMHGPHGLGKSHLACVTGAYWIKRMNRSGLYVQWANFLDTVRKGFKLDKNGQHLPADVLAADAQSLIGVGVLVVDDLSTGKSSFTDWAIDQLYLVLDGRIGKPTILVSNLTLQQYVDKLLATGYDAAPKVADRLGSGPGGNVAGCIRFKSKHGSYRQKNGGVHG